MIWYCRISTPCPSAKDFTPASTRTLKATMIALEAAARLTSSLVGGPTASKRTRTWVPGSRVLVQALQGPPDGLHRALHVRLEDDVEVLDLPQLDLGQDLVQAEAPVPVLGGAVGALLQQGAQGPLVGDDAQAVAGGGHGLQAGDLHRGRRAGLGDALAPEVGHRPHPAPGLVHHHEVARAEGAVLHQDGGHRAPAAVELGLDHGPRRRAVGVGLGLLQVGDQEDHLQQVVQAQLLQGGDLHRLHLAAPAGDEDVVLGELLADAVRVGVGRGRPC